MCSDDLRLLLDRLERKAEGERRFQLGDQGPLQPHRAAHCAFFREEQEVHGGLPPLAQVSLWSALAGGLTVTLYTYHTSVVGIPDHPALVLLSAEPFLTAEARGCANAFVTWSAQPSRNRRRIGNGIGTCTWTPTSSETSWISWAFHEVSRQMRKMVSSLSGLIFLPSPGTGRDPIAYRSWVHVLRLCCACSE